MVAAERPSTARMTVEEPQQLTTTTTDTRSATTHHQTRCRVAESMTPRRDTASV
jgi:hypothetical protein